MLEVTINKRARTTRAIPLFDLNELKANVLSCTVKACIEHLLPFDYKTREMQAVKQQSDCFKTSAILERSRMYYQKSSDFGFGSTNFSRARRVDDVRWGRLRCPGLFAHSAADGWWNLDLIQGL